MKYYSTMRPVGPGTYPAPEWVSETHNFAKRTYIPEADLEAWGWIDYRAELDADIAYQYDLVPDYPTWFKVVVMSKKRGGGLKSRAQRVPFRSAEQPPTEHYENGGYECKAKYFASLDEADRAADEINRMDVTFERARQSATQGEVKMYVRGNYVLNFGDKIDLIRKGDNKEYYGADIGGWASVKPDSSFCLGLVWHPYDEIYHYSDMVRKAMEG